VEGSAGAILPHAFLATVNKQNAKTDDEFHTGIFIRTRHASANPRAGKLTPKGFAGRLAIKQSPARWPPASNPPIQRTGGHRRRPRWPVSAEGGDVATCQR
jgi:hypothetical protein